MVMRDYNPSTRKARLLVGIQQVQGQLPEALSQTNKG